MCVAGILSEEKRPDEEIPHASDTAHLFLVGTVLGVH